MKCIRQFRMQRYYFFVILQNFSCFFYKQNNLVRRFLMETVKVLNIDIQNITRQELLENLKEGVLVTPNLDHLIKLQKDKEFYDVYQKSEWVVCDSKII